MTNQFIKQQQELAREETAKHCHEAYDGLLQPEIIEGTIKYWNARTDAIIERVVTNTGEELTRRVNSIKEEVERQTGSFKYSDQYDDCIKIITQLTGVES